MEGDEFKEKIINGVESKVKEDELLEFKLSVREGKNEVINEEEEKVSKKLSEEGVM